MTEKNLKELKKKLFIDRKKYVRVPVGSETRYEDLIKEYIKFIGEAKTERETIEKILKTITNNGFEEFQKDKKYSSGSKLYFVNGNKSMIVVLVGDDFENFNLRIIASHVDSPHLDLKLNPVDEKSGFGYLKTHYYGGIKKYQWLTIPLALHGVVCRKDGTEIKINIGEKSEDICFCISDLLPHLAREQMNKTVTKFIDGESLTVLSSGAQSNSEEYQMDAKFNILSAIYDKFGITEHDLQCAELQFVPNFKPQIVGFDKFGIGGYGQDDRVCAFASLKALSLAKEINHTRVLYFADKEETGSDGTTGARSSFFRDSMAKFLNQFKATCDEVFPKSICLSGDVDAAFDPMYPEFYDKLNSAHLGQGVAITKYTGYGGKFGGSDASAELVSLITKKFSNSNIIYQVTGGLGKVDTGGGGTVAKYLANLNIPTIDVGVPVLSMHSPFEITSGLDLFELVRAYTCFYTNI
ncbi:MAG: aminopeptidase [Oscillospiraceae bacterium]|jgi:aspartyl aminopeptidase|nr:aminopeptidase [Oscillospiraceae bacterium]